MAATQDKTDEVKFSHQVADFIQKYRKGIFISFAAIILLLAGSIITITVRDRIQARALRELDALSSRYGELRFFIGSEEDDLHQGDIALLLEDLGAFQNRNSGFPAALAYNISAHIHWEQENWAEAELAWTRAAASSGRTYLAPISLFNAAAAAEEQGNIDTAIDLYRQAVAQGTAFPAAPRAQFSIARLEEYRNNREAALQAYRTLVNQWPNDPLWTNLAQSRILLLDN